jgi:hypothetical protein
LFPSHDRTQQVLVVLVVVEKVLEDLDHFIQEQQEQ